MLITVRVSSSTHLAIIVVVLGFACTTRLMAFQLMPSPRLPEEEVRTLLNQSIAQPATISSLQMKASRSLLTADIDCDVELSLTESFYTAVLPTDPIFTPISARLAELRQAQHQIDLVPKEFIASIGGQKSTASLAFLKHTFVRTAVPAQTRARIRRSVRVWHNNLFFTGKWGLRLEGPPLAIAGWRGQPLGQFKDPLPVDSTEYQKQLNAFLDSAKKTLEEVDDISYHFAFKDIITRSESRGNR